MPLARVEALDVQQGPLQRLFGVQSVLVQTGGGGKGGEITLPALSARRRCASCASASACRAAALDPQASGCGSALGALLVTALTAGQLGVVVPVLAVGFQVAAAGARGRGRRAAPCDALPDTTGEWALLA